MMMLVNGNYSLVSSFESDIFLCIPISTLLRHFAKFQNQVTSANKKIKQP